MLANVQMNLQKKAFAGVRSRRSCTCFASTLPSQFKTVAPIGDRVLVSVDKPEPRTVGGVLLPAVSQQNSTAGTVVSVGEVAQLKKEDRVLYSKFAGTDITIGDDAHVLLKEDDVIGWLPPNELIEKLQPLGDRLLVKAYKPESKTSGGLLLSESMERPNFGTVVNIGTGRKKEDSDELEKPNASAGQTVMYSPFSGVEFEEGDDLFVVIRESDILAALS